MYMFFTDDLFQTNVDDKDGLEVVAKIFFFLPTLSLMAGTPTLLFGIHHNLPFFRHFNTGYISITLFSVLILFYIYAVDWLVVVTMMFSFLVHANATSKCLQKMITSRYVCSLLQ